MPNKQDFITEINIQLNRARQQGLKYVTLTSKQIHTNVGGYPGKNHAMPTCCGAMREIQQQVGGKTIYAPPKGNGATLEIEYIL